MFGDIVKSISSTFTDTFSDVFSTTSSNAKKASERNKAWMLQEDKKKFETFKKHEENLLLNPGNEVGIPKYYGNHSIKKKTELLAEFFNARKASALQQMTMPGINQTRNM